MLYLIERDGIWFYNRRVSKDLISEVASSFMRRSHGTSDKSEAQRRRNIENVLADAKFAELRAGSGREHGSDVKRFSGGSSVPTEVLGSVDI